MSAPCGDCPFRRSRTGAFGLRLERMEEIADGLRRGSVFSCHKTLGDEGERVPGRERSCVGAWATMENEGILEESQMARIEIRLGMLTPEDLELDLVYDSLDDWIEAAHG